MGITIAVYGNISEDVVRLINHRYKIEKVVYGGITSSDVINWALKNHVSLITYPCDHHKHKDKAVFVQHFKILRDASPDLILIKVGSGLVGDYLESIAKDMNLKVLVVK